MEIQRLAGLIEAPEVHRMLVGDYDGSYSIGVTTHPDGDGEPAIRLRIESADPSGIPSEIVLDGEPVRVLVQTRFAPPHRLPLKVPV